MTAAAAALPGLFLAIRRLREEVAPSPELALAEALAEALAASMAGQPVECWLAVAGDAVVNLEHRAGLRRGSPVRL
jgi:hypothetical protein